MLKVTVTVDQRQLDAYLKRLDKNRGKPLLYRAEKTVNAAAARVLVPAARAAAPVGQARRIAGGPVRVGNLRRRTKAKSLRKRAGEVIRPTWVGSSAYYSRFVQQGTSSHSLAPRAGKSPYAAFAIDVVRPLAGMWHPDAKANPFMATVADQHMDEVVDLIRKDVFDTK